MAGACNLDPAIPKLTLFRWHLKVSWDIASRFNFDFGILLAILSKIITAFVGFVNGHLFQPRH
jgi:hypothetical protein